MDVTHSLDRWLHRGNRPHLTARILKAWAKLAGAGCSPRELVRLLDVTGRRTGRTVPLPVLVVDVQGERYLTSMLGEGSNWVKNVTTAGGSTVLCRRYQEQVQHDEVPFGERHPTAPAEDHL